MRGGRLGGGLGGGDGEVAGCGERLADSRQARRAGATARLRGAIRPVEEWAGVAAAFAEDAETPGWVDVPWSRPTGAALDAVVERLKALKLTIRNAPLGQSGAGGGACVFTGAPAVERVLIGRAY